MKKSRARMDSGPVRAARATIGRTRKRFLKRAAAAADDSPYPSAEIPPLEESQLGRVQPPSGTPRPVACLSDEDITALLQPGAIVAAGHSAARSAYNPYSPWVLRYELKRRKRERCEARFLTPVLDALLEKPTDSKLKQLYVNMAFLVESAFNSKARDRLRALEALARIEKMFTDTIEVLGPMTEERRDSIAVEAVRNYVRSKGIPLNETDIKLLPPSQPSQP